MFTQGKGAPLALENRNISHITDAEMEKLNKHAVNALYKLLWLKQNDPEEYQAQIEFGKRYRRFWDEPETKVG
jgi:hypothetical protein